MAINLFDDPEFMKILLKDSERIRKLAGKQNTDEETILKREIADLTDKFEVQIDNSIADIKKRELGENCPYLAPVVDPLIESQKLIAEDRKAREKKLRLA